MVPFASRLWKGWAFKPSGQNLTENHMSQDNIVYIGRKPVMSYVMAVLTTLNKRNAQSVELKARGRSITTAVDVAEITRGRYMTDLSKPVIKIETEKITDGELTRNVSCISITLTREGKQAKAAEPKAAEPKTVQSPDVSSIKGVGAVTAEKLKAGGYGTVAKVKGAKPTELAAATGLTEKQAENIIKAAGGLQG
jgi:DNA-binding protein